MVQNSSRKAAIPSVGEVKQKTGTLTQQRNAPAHGATGAGALEADLQLQLGNAEFQENSITL